MIAEAYRKYEKFLAANSQAMARALDVIQEHGYQERGKQYLDQNLWSLMHLLALGISFRPSVIVEVGTAYGGSACAWAQVTRRAKTKMFAVDRNHAPWRLVQPYLKEIGVAVSDVIVLQGDALTLAWSALFGSDSVLLFLDVHDTPDCPLMESFIQRAFPLLVGKRHLVVAHDFFFQGTDRYGAVHDVLPAHVDLKKLVKVPYEGGYFLGFGEVPILVDWAERNGVVLHSVEAELRHDGMLEELRARHLGGGGLSEKDCWSSLIYFEVPDHVAP